MVWHVHGVCSNVKVLMIMIIHISLMYLIHGICTCLVLYFERAMSKITTKEKSLYLLVSDLTRKWLSQAEVQESCL